jgi:hypothetical protein
MTKRRKIEKKENRKKSNFVKFILLTFISLRISIKNN